MPATSKKQKRFMCAEYGRAKGGKKTRSGISRKAARDFCKAPVKGKGKR